MRALAGRLFRNLPPRFQRTLADAVGDTFEQITYRRVSDLGFRPAGIIDVGAFEGYWSKTANQVFGNVPTLMIEAQPGKQPALDAMAATLGDATVAIALLSDKPGEERTFFEMGTGSSLLAENSDAPRTERKFITNTLDDVVAAWRTDISPLFLKIDAQGAEMMIIAGAAETLKRVELIQLEVGLLQYNAQAPLIGEVIATMASLGYVPIEISGFGRVVGHLAQIDVIFAKSDSRMIVSQFSFQENSSA